MVGVMPRQAGILEVPYIRGGFFKLGLMGYVVASALGVFMAHRLELSWAIHITSQLVATGVFFGLLFVSKLSIGREVIVSYQHQVAIVASVWLLLSTLEAPTDTHLAVILAGVAITRGVGRIGCFVAGCCHGILRPRGVAYGPEHVVSGFPREIAGQGLFPVQLIESTYLLTTGFTCAGLLLLGAAPSVVIWIYVVAAFGGRLVADAWRGDGGNRRFTNAQVVSVIVLSAMTVVQALGLVSGSWKTTLAVLVVGAVCAWQMSDRRLLLSLLQVRSALQALSRAALGVEPPTEPKVSRGGHVLVSVGDSHYTVSSDVGTPRQLHMLARSLASAANWRDSQLIAAGGSENVVHVTRS